MLLILFLFGLALGAVSASDDHQVRVQPGNSVWQSFNGRYYKYVATQMTWADAELNCVSEGANLVSIHSLEEEDFVKSLTKNVDHEVKARSWIGLSDVHKEGSWMWSDGSAVDFDIWSPGQPDNARGNEHCVHINYVNDLKWNDIPCSMTRTSICASHITSPQ
ncbi:lactose-binding lectin l-2-like [Micropterus dolomieu]|uniref:lactose-binding lectin l-2-like n=1 Tax=Micropterus dolomieu TaxID=147949 RepID=UPI001E8DE3A3|nr:lactose-binding lectin l-2-like [Micropterus dolomieu]